MDVRPAIAISKGCEFLIIYIYIYIRIYEVMDFVTGHNTFYV